MLPEFKKRIDTLRDILVGAVPSPAGQIEQITYALIYKFMSDIDDKSASIGGKRTYFTGEYEKYGWHELMTPTLGAHDRLTLYREALGSLAKNPGLPELFQGIYQNAYLTFNDPRVLTLFLKEIDNFKHSNSDDIGDAYEYLLQITGAQGDVGQFRTPRHIIKFIVEAVNPTKSDSVLDPAAGTAGFLIAAYNHVKHHHDGVDEITGLADEQEERLTSDELDKLHKSYHGFDIDPTMVRTAKVNMYLHGFKTPDIKNHDSLSSEDWWNERYDVVLANPPFMSPKGGIKPHDKFGIQANRAEVLFVDYIASHLKPTGRAGIVVPEGIIFQNGKAYKELRKNLVDNYLYAVVSLPAGVFQPYSGVKTSVLLLDKEFAKQRDEILFVNVANDGLSISTSRSIVNGNQLPQALEDIGRFKRNVDLESSLSFSVSRSLIARDGEYNLTGERYKLIESITNSNFEQISLNEVIEESTERVRQRDIPVWSVSNKKGFINPDEHFNKKVASDDTSNYKIVSEQAFAYNPSRINVGSIALNSKHSTGSVSPMYVVFKVNQTRLLSQYLFALMKSDYFNKEVGRLAQGAVRTQLKFKDLSLINVPLPSIEIQREIITELDGHQKIIDAARTIIKTYKPSIKISPEWNTSTVDDIAKLEYGIGEGAKDSGNYRYIRISDIDERGLLKNADKKYIDDTSEAKKYVLEKGDVLVARTGATFGKTLYFNEEETCAFAGFLIRFKFHQNAINSKFFWYFTQSDDYWKQARSLMTGGAQPQFNANAVSKIVVPLPSLEEQKQIVAQLESEQRLIDANKKLIDLYTQKIKTKIAEVWGE